MEDEEHEHKELILSIDDDGKASIYNPDEFVEMTKNDADLIKGFLNENWEKFEEYRERNKN